MCMRMSDKQYTTARVVGEFIGMVGRTLRSFLFNVLVFVVGFWCGCMFSYGRVHHFAVQHDSYEYAVELQKALSEQNSIYEKNYESNRELISKMKSAMSHEVHPACETCHGKIFLRTSTDK